MNTESAQPTQKILEYQEAGKALRAAEQARRTAITFFGISTIALLSFIYSRTIPADTCAYLSIAGSILSLMSFLLFMKYTRAIKLISEQLLTLQDTIGGSVYSSSTLTGLSERNFYTFIYVLVGVVFVVTSIFYVRDASARNHLVFQSCGPYAEIALGDEEVACPCGKYPFPNEKQGACPIRSSFDEKGL